MELIYSAFVLSKKELSFLAGAMGIKRLYGMLDDEQPDEAELYRILNRLIKKGFVTTDGDSFVIDSEVRRLIELMAADKAPVFISDPDRIEPAKCVYIKDDSSVVCEQCRASEELRVYALKSDEARKLIERGNVNEEADEK